jgi:hypothetical protein
MEPSEEVQRLAVQQNDYAAKYIKYIKKSNKLNIPFASLF